MKQCDVCGKRVDDFVVSPVKVVKDICLQCKEFIGNYVRDNMPDEDVLKNKFTLEAIEKIRGKEKEANEIA